MSFCKFSIVLKYINENAAFPLEIVFNQKYRQKMEKQCNRYIHTILKSKFFNFSLTQSRLEILLSKLPFVLILPNNEPASEN